MGYFGKTSMYLPANIRQAAYNAEGWILEFYRGFNVSWTQPAKYFDAHSSIDKDRLKKCVDTRLMVSQAMEVYADITGDWHGVEILTDDNGNRVVRGKCWDEYFWYPPACRDEPSKCVIFFTGGSGWNLEETMQKATAWWPLQLQKLGGTTPSFHCRSVVPSIGGYQIPPSCCWILWKSPSHPLIAPRFYGETSAPHRLPCQWTSM